MQWFKHDSDANMDAKLQQILADYGLEGYGLYWYCVELITRTINKDNLTFVLEHDAKIIAKNTNSTTQRVEEMMRRFIELGLFDNENGAIRCLKLLKRLDKSMTSNPDMRAVIDAAKKANSHDAVRIGHDSVMTKSGIVMQEEKRREEKRVNHDAVMPDHKKFTDDHLAIAKRMLKKIQIVAPKTKTPNLENWADTIRLMQEQDDLALNEIESVFNYANADEFWSLNILSPTKLRKQFAVLHAKAKKTPQQPTDDIEFYAQ